MENIFWNWNDMSNKAVPNRNIKWEFRIPYILSVSGSLFTGFSFSIRFLLFCIHFITDVSCGRSICLRVFPWLIVLSINNGWSFDFYVGLSKTAYLSWITKRLLKKMTPEKLKEFIDGLSEDKEA